MILYRNKEIKHPILREYKLDYRTIHNYPYSSDNFEKNENKISSLLNNIINKKNELSSL